VAPRTPTTSTRWWPRGRWRLRWDGSGSKIEKTERVREGNRWHQEGWLGRDREWIGEVRGRAEACGGVDKALKQVERKARGAMG
jgi:hypothetical protein